MSQHPLADVERYSSHRISRRKAMARTAAAVAGAVVAPRLMAAPELRKVVVWSEGTANVDPASKKVYPNDINFAIAEGLKPLAAQGWEISTATLSDPDQGLSESRLNSTDVLIWWGHRNMVRSKTIS